MSLPTPVPVDPLSAHLSTVDWTAHPLGPPDRWPLSLTTMLRALFASAEPMYLVWGDHHTFFCNQAFAPTLGSRRDAALGARLEDVWGDAYAAVEPFVRAALEGRSRRVVDSPMTTADDAGPRDSGWTMSYTPAFDDDGAIAGVVCIANETTAERHALTALAESEHRLRRAEQAGRVGVFSIDVGSTLLTGTPEFFKLFGLPPTTTLDTAAVERLVVPDDAAIASHAQSRASQDMALHVEYRIRRPDTGEVRTIERRAEFEHDANGAAVRLVGVVQDVTERRRDRDALARLNATLEATVVERTQALLLHENIVQSDATPICAFDTDFRLIAFNQAHNDEFFRVNGFYTELGDVFPDLFVLEQQPVMRALMARALTGESFTVEEEFGNPAIDAPRWEIHYSALRDADGRIFGAFHHARDISARLRTQAELATAQEALRQSQKMEAIGQLTGGVAHDFNNLLTPILGGLDILQRRGLGGERDRRLLDGAMRSAERARTLVQRLLAFARRQPLQPVAVDVARLVAGMGELVASTVGPTIRVAIDAPPAGLPAASADPNQLEMALLNLAVNARDAMPDGGTLRIATTVEGVEEGERDLQPGRYVRLAVSDTGAGMDAQTMARAIEPFFSTKGVGQGTGLGLSMVHGLASQLGGALRLDSRPGRGTEVALWLPESDAVAEPIALSAESATLTGHGVALLVDDEDYVRLSTAAMLADLGYRVVEAASAEAALALMEANPAVDLVITDHLMPGMTGSDFARVVRRRWPSLPVLVISGYAESEGIEPDLPRLTKPFRRDEMVRRLAALRS